MPKPTVQPVEPEPAWQRFTDALKQVVGVSKDELKRREVEWQGKRKRAKRAGTR